MSLPKKIESTSDYNLVAENIFVQLDMGIQDCMTLLMLRTFSIMHCMLKWKRNAVYPLFQLITKSH